MKWIKHMTATRRDEKVARLVAKHGLEGYGLYWAVQEIIGEQMEGQSPVCQVSYPVSVWANNLATPPQHVKTKLQWLAGLGLVSVTCSDGEILVSNAKLLKYRDEYSRKSGHTPEQLPARTEGDKEGEQSKTKTKTIARSVPPQELAGTLPLAKKGMFYEVSKSQVGEWSQAFPGIEVKQELRKMKVWLDANPTKRKTIVGMPRAIVRWLSNAQDRIGGRNHGENGRNSKGDANLIALEAARGAAGPLDAGFDFDGDQEGRPGFAAVSADDRNRVVEGELVSSRGSD